MEIKCKKTEVHKTFLNPFSSSSRLLSSRPVEYPVLSGFTLSWHAVLNEYINTDE